MSTALGQLRPLNPIEVSWLKKILIPTVGMALWFIGMFNKEKICSLVVMPCISDLYVGTGIP